MARPKKTEASVAIEKRLCEMEKDKPKVYNIMDDGKFGQKITGQRFTQCATCGVEFEQNIAWTTTDIQRGKRVRVAEAN